MSKTKNPDAVIASALMVGATVTLSTVGTKPAPASALTRYTVDYGDGSPLVSGSGKPPLTLQPYTYASAGSYRIWLQVWDRNTLTDKDSRVVDVTVPAPPPDPIPIPPPSPPVPAPVQAVLTASDFTYLGAMRLPDIGYAQDEDPTWSYGALAARKVNGVLQFFMTGSNVKGDRVFEFIDTQSYALDYRQAPRAQMATYWGDIYQGKRTSWMADGTQYTPQYLFTRGLLWHNNRLYWTYFNGYNVTNYDDWCIGLTDLGSSPATTVAHGPWRPTTPGQGPGVKHASWWLVDMPDGTLGAGSSLMSGNLVSSWGPELVAGCPFPSDLTPSGFGQPNLVFPQTYAQYQAMYGRLNLDGSLPAGQEILALKRAGNYVFHNTNPSVGYAEAPTEIDPVKNGGVGTFTQADGVCSCVYIDLPDKAGILFLGSEGTGHVWYGPNTNCGHGFADPCGGGQGPAASGHAQQWWIYDPHECRKVADQQMQPWQVQPSSAFDPATAIAPLQQGCQRSPGGAYFDTATRRLYVAALKADDSIFGLALPLIHVFEIR